MSKFLKGTNAGSYEVVRVIVLALLCCAISITFDKIFYPLPSPRDFGGTKIDTSSNARSLGFQCIIALPFEPIRSGNAPT